MADDGKPPLAAPLAHAALGLLTVLPLLVHVPTNANIVLTAALTVWVGCRRSVKPEPPAEAMSKQDAMKFPLIGSVVLFSLYLAFKFLPKHIVNAILSAYFVFLGMIAIVASLEPEVAPLVPDRWSAYKIKLRLPAIPLLLKDGAEYPVTPLELLISLPASAFCTWYYRRKHWFANNLLGLAFSIQGIEHLSLGAVQNGVILLCGLFFYDIFWVFGTPVMVSVAKNFDAPIKLLFPRLGELVDGKSQFSMLGLGDIVIPGIFVAILLRHDAARHFKTNYFLSSFGGYVAGLVTTIVVMNVFQAAQPALLYIVPGVLGAALTHAAIRGEVREVFFWQEKEEPVADDGKEEAKAVEEEKAPAAAAAEGSQGVESLATRTRSASKASKKET